MLMVDHIAPAAKRPRDTSAYMREAVESRGRVDDQPVSEASGQLWAGDLRAGAQAAAVSGQWEEVKDSRELWMNGDALGGRGLDPQQGTALPGSPRADLWDGIASPLHEQSPIRDSNYDSLNGWWGGDLDSSKWQNMDAKVKATIIVDDQAASAPHSGTWTSQQLESDAIGLGSLTGGLGSFMADGGAAAGGWDRDWPTSSQPTQVCASSGTAGGGAGLEHQHEQGCEQLEGQAGRSARSGSKGLGGGGGGPGDKGNVVAARSPMSWYGDRLTLSAHSASSKLESAYYPPDLGAGRSKSHGCDRLESTLGACAGLEAHEASSSSLQVAQQEAWGHVRGKGIQQDVWERCRNKATVSRDFEASHAPYAASAHWRREWGSAGGDAALVDGGAGACGGGSVSACSRGVEVQARSSSSRGALAAGALVVSLGSGGGGAGVCYSSSNNLMAANRGATASASVASVGKDSGSVSMASTRDVKQESTVAWSGRRRKTREREASASVALSTAPEACKDAASKNKNCHYCEHAPKRSAFFACLNPSCDQTFCENCCARHLGSPTLFSCQEDANQSDWRCPICTRQCCCVQVTCNKKHLHCKRYRRKLKTLRTNAATTM